MWYVVSKDLPKEFCFVRFIIFGMFFLSILIGCGGPPQFPAEGEETPALVDLDSSTPVDFVDRVAGQDFIFTLQLNNLSRSVPATQLALSNGPFSSYSFRGGNYPGTNGTCSNQIAEGGSCLLELQFSPTVAGVYNSTLLLQYFDGLNIQTLNLNLSAQVRDPYPAQLTFNPSGPLDFGVIAVGGFREINVALQNEGEQDATALNFSGFAPPFSIPSTSCGGTLAAFSTCHFVLRFSPTLANTFPQTLNVDYHDGFLNQLSTLSMNGEGRIAGFITILEGNTFDYGVLLAGHNSQRTLTLRNTGGGIASAITFSGLAAPFSLVSNTCPLSLTPGQSCQVVVQYSPTATLMSVDQWPIHYNDGFDPQTTNASLMGQGFANALDLSLIQPASTPSQEGTPTLRIETLVSGLRLHLYRDSLCTSELMNGLSTGSSLDLIPNLTEGIYHFHARAEDSEGNLTVCSADSVNYQYDITPPQPPTNITFTPQYSDSANQSPLLEWTASPSGDVVDYQVGISTSSTGGNAHGGFTSKGNVTSATEIGLSLTECQYYYVSVQSIDHVGLTSLTYNVSSTAFRYDSAAPTAPTNLNEEGDSSVNNSATVSWTQGSDACGVSHYEVAVSEDLNANNILDPGELGNVVGFTNVGNITSHRFNAIALTNGVTHFTSVRTVDTTGRASPGAVSDPWIVYDPSVELPNMILWLDGNDPTTIVDNNGRNALDGAFNGQVNRWFDKSGSPVDHDFQISSGASRPSFDSLNFSVLFNGTNTGMTTPDHSEINSATVIQRNITVAFRTSTDITNRQILYEEGGNIRGMNLYILNNQIYCGFYNTPAGDGDGTQPFTWVSTPVAANQNFFVTWVFDYTNYTGPSGPDGTLTCYVNNLNIGSVPTTSRLFAHTGNVGLGHIDDQSCFEDNVCRNTGSNFMGNIFEVMLFNDAPSGADVTKVHTYLDNKWN